MPNLYALLVGINGYPTKPLQGCINDVNAVKTYLEEASNSSGMPLKLHVLTDDGDTQPTRENVIKGFEHFDQAKGNDVCLFYYSGHGSYSAAPPELRDESHGNNESFVCIDSRTAGGRDLMDKEMSFLIWKATLDKPDVTFVAITDCCHSGTITKAMLPGGKKDNGITERMMSANNVPARVEDYLGFDFKHTNGDKAYDITIQATGPRVTVKRGRHIHLAASADHQTSKELLIDNKKRGAFTHSLLKALYAAQGKINYRDLVNNAGVQVKLLVPDQDPLLNLNNVPPTDEGKIFLAKELAANDGKFAVFYDMKHKWCIKAGQLQSVAVGDGVAIDGVGDTTVTATLGLDVSQVKEVQGLSMQKQYRGAVTRLHLEPVKFAFAEDVPPAMRKVLLEAEKRLPGTDASIAADTNGQYIIRVKNKEASVSLPGQATPLFKPVMIDDERGANEFFADLVKVAEWSKLLARTNEQSALTSKDYALELFVSDVKGNHQPVDFKKHKQVDLYYRKVGDNWEKPSIRLKFKNTSATPLFVDTAYLAFNFAIEPSVFLPKRVEPGTEIFFTVLNRAAETDVIQFEIDDEFTALGYSEITEHLKIFVSSTPPQLAELAQSGLAMPPLETRAVSKGVARGSGGTLWQTETIGLHIVKPLNEVPLSSSHDTQVQALKVKPHALKANVNLNSSSLATRSANQVSPPHMVNGNTLLAPFDLSLSSRSDVVMDVLELTGVQNKDAVTAQQPLMIDLPIGDTVDGDLIVPMGYSVTDRLYYPVGHNDKGTIVIESLPEETDTDAAITGKSFLGSIKIYFQRVVREALGMEPKYPQLAVATMKDGKPHYETDTKEIAKEVKAATQILLFVHGIIGDTKGMVQCAELPASNGRTLRDGNRLILTFDYENLGTKIEDNAVKLKDALAEVGLIPGHGKNLVIAAHSMGGLVSRYFIEEKDGHQVVSKLIMLGTPNNGTPWADVRDMAETMLTMAINGAVFLKPYTFAISALGYLFKGTQVSFKQMDTESDFYKAINPADNKGVPYAIIAGNTQAIDPVIDAEASRVVQFLSRVKQRAVYAALDKAIFKRPNDIAVTVDSIRQVGDGSLSGLLKTYEVPCDHLNYFTRVDSLKVLAEECFSSKTLEEVR